VMRIKRTALLSLFSIALLLVMLFPVCLIAEIYKWVDEEGVIYFTDDLDEVPLKYRPELISPKPGLKKPEISPRQEDWSSMTYQEKVEYLRRLREKRAEEDRKIEGYPEDIQQLIRNHKLKVGMTKEMVLLSWGNPVDIRPRSPRNVQERWIYPASQADKSAYAYFENDTLTGWEE
jgi:hypothetical protein